MTVSLKLDTAAVLELFKDPEAKLELQRAIIANIVKKFAPKDYVEVEVKELVRTELKAQLYTTTTVGGRPVTILKQEVASQMRAFVLDVATEAIEQAKLDTPALLQELLTKGLVGLEEKAENWVVSRLTEAQTALIQEKIDERWAQIKASVS